MRWVIAAVLMTACAHAPPPATASTERPPPVPGEERPVPPDLEAEVRRVQATALFLVESLDEMFAAVRALRDSDAALLDGFLAVLALPTPWARGWDVLFVAERKGGGVAVVYEGRHPADSSDRSYQRLDDPRPLVGVEADAWSARQLAADQYLRNGACRGSFQALVLPPHEGSDDFTIYILPSFGKDRIAIGGFRRIRVSADVQRVLADEPLTEGCRASSGQGKSIQVRNRVVDVPDEMSVMHAIGFPWTFEVVTARGRWDITSGRIRFLGEAGP